MYGSFDEEDRDDEFFFTSPPSRPTPFSIYVKRLSLTISAKNLKFCRQN